MFFLVKVSLGKGYLLGLLVLHTRLKRHNSETGGTHSTTAHVVPVWVFIFFPSVFSCSKPILTSNWCSKLLLPIAFLLFLPKLIRIFCTFMSTRVHGCEDESWHLFSCLLLGLFDWRRKMPGTRSGIRFPCILPWHYPRTTWEWQIEEAHWHIVQGLCCMACTSALPHVFFFFNMVNCVAAVCCRPSGR